MALVFTRHARKRILERGIRVDEIHEATESPTVTGDTIVVTLYEVGGAVIVVRGVPAEVCQQCGETYTDEDTTRQLEKIVDKARRASVVVIQEYQAA